MLAKKKTEPTNEIIKTNQTLVIDLIEVNIDIVEQTEEKKTENYINGKVARGLTNGT